MVDEGDGWWEKTFGDWTDSVYITAASIVSYLPALDIRVCCTTRGIVPL